LNKKKGRRLFSKREDRVAPGDESFAAPRRWRRQAPPSPRRLRPTAGPLNSFGPTPRAVVEGFSGCLRGIGEWQSPRGASQEKEEAISAATAVGTLDGYKY
jgi:hypothetical protein